jgi:hypothetical protein
MRVERTPPTTQRAAFAGRGQPEGCLPVPVGGIRPKTGAQWPRYTPGGFIGIPAGGYVYTLARFSAAFQEFPQAGMQLAVE